MYKILCILCFFIVIPYMLKSEELSWDHLPKLTADSFLTYSYSWDSKIKKTILTVFIVEEEQQIQVFNIAGLSGNRIQLTHDKQRLFYLIDDLNDENGMDDLWLFDGVKGEAKILQKVSPSFILSDDGQFLCYKDNRYIKKVPWSDGRNYSQVSIPVIVVHDLYKGSITELDLSNSILNDQWGIGTKISYESGKKLFRIYFTSEGEVLYRYYYELESGMFFPE